MSFWSNLGRDYFKTGIGDTLKNAVKGLILKMRLGDILDKQTPYDITQTPQTPQTPQKIGAAQALGVVEPEIPVNRSFPESGNVTLPTNQLELIEGKTTPQVQGAPPMKRDGESGAPRGETETASNNEFAQQEQRTKQQAKSTNPNWLAQHTTGVEAPLIPNDEKKNINSDALTTLLNDPLAREKYNRNVARDILNFKIKSTQLGREDFSKLADEILGYQTVNPKTPEFDAKQFVTDTGGNVYRYKYNVADDQWYPTPITDKSGKQLQTALPLYNKDEWQPVDIDGNAVMTNVRTGEQKPLNVKYEDFDKKYHLNMLEWQTDDWYKRGLIDLKTKELMLKEMKLNKSGSGTGDGEGDEGTTTGDNSGFVIEDKTTGSELTPQYIPKTAETVKRYGDIAAGWYYVTEKGLVPAERISNNIVKTKSGYKVNAFEPDQYNMKIRSKKEKHQTWGKLFDDQYKKAQQGDAEAQAWLKKKENIDYARSIGKIK